MLYNMYFSNIKTVCISCSSTTIVIISKVMMMMIYNSFLFLT